MQFEIIIKDETEQTIDTFTVESSSNLMALLEGQKVFLSRHPEYEMKGSGMWIGNDTYKRDLTVEFDNIEIDFTIEIGK